MASVANINDVLEGHVALEIEFVDRLYLNAYVPNLQVGGHVVRFLCGHLGQQIPSPALLGPIGNRFRREVKQFATERGIPILQRRGRIRVAGTIASSITSVRTLSAPSAKAATGWSRSSPATSSSGYSRAATGRFTPRPPVCIRSVHGFRHYGGPAGWRSKVVGTPAQRG
jgi:hypothetical protein